MNFKAKPSKLNWKKITFIVILMACASYRYYVDDAPPQITGTRSQETREPDQKTRSVDDRKSQTLPGSSSTQSKSPNEPRRPSGKFTQPESLQSKSRQSTKPFFTSIGRQKKKSPAGLVYGMGGGGEHRTEHVLRHAKDQPNRPSHGVFTAQGDDVFRLIDESYELVKDKSKRVKSESSRGNIAHVIDMKRKIGFKGGQSGARNGNPALYKVKLVLANGNEVITAYPY
ncbi:MAG: hypothetical protein P8J27_16585 [Mariniblastus sp.]|nr:hypothetical protein [Mariniblastus sp.]